MVLYIETVLAYSVTCSNLKGCPLRVKTPPSAISTIDVCINKLASKINIDIDYESAEFHVRNTAKEQAWFLSCFCLFPCIKKHYNRNEIVLPWFLRGFL